ncbi:uncharacterized protein LOC135378212 [Ornithodoros turicata]|uniref:uncharacterized protein LOC135378212 n=1 Tax=Ornithodoros turicata TaxID=34597 RepID=UPI003138B4BA
MRRQNLFKKVKDGGLGLQHLYIKQLVMRLFFYRQSSHPILDTIKRALAYNYIPDIYVGFHEESLRLSGFYKEVVESLNFLKARFSLEYLFSVAKKTLVVHLLDVLFPVPIYRQIPSGWHGTDVLCRVRKMPVKPNMKSFFFKLHTSTLPVKAWLQQKGLYVPWSVNCRFCNTPETVDHLFLDCTEALFFWDDLQFKVLKRRLSLNPHTIRFLPLRPGENVRYDIVLLVAMYCLWKLRMADRNEEPLCPPMKYFKAELLQVKLACTQLLEVPEWLDTVCERLNVL